MSRMILRLTELGLTRRLSWPEVADIQADHEADLAAAIEQAVSDQMCFSEHAAQARHVATIYQLLGGKVAS